jgi:hypothetical protein
VMCIVMSFELGSLIGFAEAGIKYRNKAPQNKDGEEPSTKPAVVLQNWR